MARHSLFEYQNIDGKSFEKTVEVSSEVIQRFAAEHESGVARLIAFSKSVLTSDKTTRNRGTACSDHTSRNKFDPEVRLEASWRC